MDSHELIVDDSRNNKRMIIGRVYIFDQFIQQIDDNAHVTFNGKYLLDGSMGGSIAADEQGVILDFMGYLDNSTLSAQAAPSASIVKNGPSLIERMETAPTSVASPYSAASAA